MRIDVDDRSVRNARFQFAVEHAALVETQIVGEYHRQQLTAGATQRYVRTVRRGSSALLQRQQLAVVTKQGNGFVGYLLREDTTFRLADGVADGIHVDQAGAIEAE